MPTPPCYPPTRFLKVEDATVFARGSSHWSPDGLADLPLVDFVYKERLVVSVQYYERGEEWDDIESFLADPKEWISEHFGPWPPANMEDDDEHRYDRPPFTTRKECRVIPNAWDS